ncbi:hypothetical protein [Haloarchaeobius iranensis]|uniref:TrbL/VirB6 plasmid conjugal transfer protein n=1 Tax=Haloarchaeobius iranensis TaxID=996166 RepID=A0A1H0BDU0_9EURY|nr:hypothetical protein [Haloarchaeobius iranensis]SDN43824.1 hypothetical protein SAMN05192554_13811 [Haloarchaeobius iranensis]
MGLKEVIIAALTDFVEALFQPLEGLVEEHGNEVLQFVVGTDAPNAIFSRPTNGVWPSLYDYYWESVVPLALGIWALSIGLVILLESTSNLFSGYQGARMKRRAFAGLLAVLSWWWIAAFSLQFVDHLGIYILPDLSDVDLIQTISYGALSAIAYAISVSVNNTLLVSIAAVYLARRIALYMFVLVMPLLIVMWIPSVGPFALVARFMKRLAGFYVPFLFMSLPAVVLFRLSAILGSNFGLSVGGLVLWVLGLVTPFLALVAPFVLFWQAGAIFMASERMGRQVSTGRLGQQLSSTKQAGQTAAHGGRNFSRGLRGDGAIRRDGQTLLNSVDSRAHAAGQRVRGTRDSLAAAFSGPSPESSTGVASEASSSGQETTRNDSFDALRPDRPSALPPARTAQTTDAADANQT